MKYLYHILGLALFLLFFSCSGDVAEEQQQTEELIEDRAPIQSLMDEDWDESFAPEEMPAPGEGTMTSQTETPLAQKNIAHYRSKSGVEIIAEYSFDDDYNGIVVLKRPDMDDITLHQKKSDPLSNGAYYTDGTHSWFADAHMGVFKTQEGKLRYELVSANQSL